MRKDLFQIEDPYWVTVNTGSTASDVAVSSPMIRSRDVRVLARLGMDSGALVLSKPAVARALKELDAVYAEFSEPNWDGYGAQAVHKLTYDKTQELLESLPSSIDTPEISADADGELTVEWRYGRDRLLSISVALNGRLSFIYRNGATRMRDTLWFTDQQLPVEMLALINILKR